MIREKQQGILAIISANVIFGLNIPVTKSLVSQWMTPAGYTITRMFFGTIVFWTIGTFLRHEKVLRKDLLVMLLGGLMGFLGTQFLFSQSLKFTTPVIFSLLMALTPVVVLLLSAVLLKEAVPKRKIAGIMLSITGAALIILSNSARGHGSPDNLLGILFAVLCVLCYAGYLVLTRTISVRYGPVTVAKWMFLFSALLVLPFSFSGLQHQKIYSDDATGLAFSLLAFALLFSTTLAFFLMPVALKKLEASTVSVFMNLQPVVASVVAIAVGQDTFSGDKPLAALLVLTGVYLVSTQSPAQKTKVLPLT
ncbi:MAG: EamA family transporter [Sinomicrobium sp.]|nr:EamA family transporter [Sinomicrobium sp.]